jgi:CheY-like chemotaxis protein
MVSLVAAIVASIVFFEQVPERSIWCTPVKQEEEHIVAVSTSWGGLSILLMQKQNNDNKAATKGQEYEEKQNRRKILIIDDEPDITLIFEKALKDNGFDEVDTVNDPIVALKNFKAGSYDLIIIDIIMAKIDGFGLYEEVRNIDNKVKVCFITAHEINYQALRAVFPAATSADNISCFIRKPIEIDDFIKHIEAELS